MKLHRVAPELKESKQALIELSLSDVLILSIASIYLHCLVTYRRGCILLPVQWFCLQRWDKDYGAHSKVPHEGK